MKIFDRINTRDSQTARSDFVRNMKKNDWSRSGPQVNFFAGPGPVRHETTDEGLRPNRSVQLDLVRKSLINTYRQATVWTAGLAISTEKKKI